MVEEFNLSEKEQVLVFIEDKYNYYKTKDVKEFIKRLKEEMKGLKGEVALDLIIDKLAGPKLTESNEIAKEVKE